MVITDGGPIEHPEYGWPRAHPYNCPMGRDTPTAAVQDYLKAIYRVEEDSGRLWVSTSELASALNVSAPSASAMLKRLAGLGYVVAGDRRGAFALTGDGRGTALEVVRRHRLLETYLVQHLGVPLADVHHEAEVLEHHISVALEARIADVLGHPDRDPHGDPIPTRAGAVDDVPATSLADVPVTGHAVVHRVGDRDPSLLRSLEGSGIVPGARLEVLSRDRHGSLRVRTGDDEVRVPAAAALVVRVTPEA